MADRAVNLTKRFGDFAAVDDISFSIGKGQIFGFLGANGAGKTTTIKMMCGLLEPTSGSLEVAGIDVVKDPEAVRMRIGYMSQLFSLYPDLTVRENLSFFGGVYGLRGRELEGRIAETLERLGMEPMRNTITGSLPLGFKQRLGLGSAALHRPEVIFLDEPTSGVDPISRVRFWEYIRHLSKTEGMTVIISTHFLNEAEYCDSIILMSAGKIVASGAPQQLKKDADHVIYQVETAYRMDDLSRLRASPGILDAYSWGRALRIAAGAGMLVPDVQRALESAGMAAGKIEAVEPSLEDVFMRYYRK